MIVLRVNVGCPVTDYQTHNTQVLRQNQGEKYTKHVEKKIISEMINYITSETHPSLLYFHRNLYVNVA